MPHDLHIPVSPQQTYAARVARVFGSGYATILLEYEGTVVEVPVQLGGALIHERYGMYWRRLMRQWVQEGDWIYVQPTGARTGGALDVVEVLDEANMPLSLHAIRQGWGIPQRDVLDASLRQLVYVYALQEARTHARGLWHAAPHDEALVQYLSAEVLERSAPLDDQPMPLISLMSTILVVVTIVWAACAVAQQRQAPTARGGLTAPVRWIWRQWSPFLARLSTRTGAPAPAATGDAHDDAHDDAPAEVGPVPAAPPAPDTHDEETA